MASRNWMSARSAPKNTVVETKVHHRLLGESKLCRMMKVDGQWQTPEGEPADHQPTHWRHTFNWHSDYRGIVS
jgi:hypothetical protein